MLCDLQGRIERITYRNDENGFTIAKVKVYGHRKLVSVVGNLMALAPGEVIKDEGLLGRKLLALPGVEP